VLAIVMPGVYESQGVSHDIRLATIDNPGAQVTQIYGTSTLAQTFEYCHGWSKDPSSPLARRLRLRAVISWL
jgi:hypothetical protein